MNRTLLAGLAAALAALVLAPAALAAEREFVPGNVIVNYADDSSAAQRAQARQAAGVLERLSVVRGVGGAQVVSIDGGVKAAVARLERSPAVEYAEPNFIYRSQAVPDDPRFDELWGLDNTGQTGGTPDADIDAPEGWDVLGLGSFPLTGGAKIGIVDTGIRQNHADLVGKTVDCGGVNNFGINLIIIIIGSDPTIVNGKCNDDNGHGTHVAGTAAAIADNGTGVAGVAFNSPLAICKALNSGGSGTLQMVANCIDWTSDRDADIISMSLGGPGSQTLETAVENATANGSLLIAAAGNSGNSSVSFPAGYAEVVSVAATDHNDQRASFSQFNADVEIAAPGVNILSTWNNGGYNTISGTSMSTPHVSGVAALIAAGNPGGGPAAWRTELQAAVDDLGAPGRDPQFGFGRVNLSKVTP
ncbi:MAG: S8 family serine peptidase [Solirubrobacterales bacterium]